MHMNFLKHAHIHFMYFSVIYFAISVSELVLTHAVVGYVSVFFHRGRCENELLTSDLHQMRIRFDTAALRQYSVHSFTLDEF